MLEQTLLDVLLFFKTKGKDYELNESSPVDPLDLATVALLFCFEEPVLSLTIIVRSRSIYSIVFFLRIYSS